MLQQAQDGEDVFGRPVPTAPTRVGERVDSGRDAYLQVVPTNQVSPAMAALQAAARLVAEQEPVHLPEAQALADAAALLTVVEQLRGAVLTRVADVDARKLHVLDGASSTSSWVDQQQTSLDRGEVALARRMSSLPTLAEAVRSGTPRGRGGLSGSARRSPPCAGTSTAPTV
jgi:hypothetical protein